MMNKATVTLIGKALETAISYTINECQERGHFTRSIEVNRLLSEAYKALNAYDDFMSEQGGEDYYV